MEVLFCGSLDTRIQVMSKYVCSMVPRERVDVVELPWQIGSDHDEAHCKKWIVILVTLCDDPR